jgi:hypothetical protein
VDKLNNESKPFVFGPFPPGFSQTFTDHEGIDLSKYSSEDLFPKDQKDEKLSPPSGDSPTAPILAVSPSTVTPINTPGTLVMAELRPSVYSMIIVLEGVSSTPATDLKKEEIGSTNTQFSFVKLSITDSTIKAKLIKNSMLVYCAYCQINGYSYILQEIYGFTEGEDTDSMNGMQD